MTASCVSFLKEYGVRSPRGNKTAEPEEGDDLPTESLEESFRGGVKGGFSPHPLPLWGGRPEGSGRGLIG